MQSTLIFRGRVAVGGFAPFRPIAPMGLWSSPDNVAHAIGAIAPGRPTMNDDAYTEAALERGRPTGLCECTDCACPLHTYDGDEVCLWCREGQHETALTDSQFRALLDLWMRLDPFPAEDELEEAFEAVLDAEAARRGHEGVVQAFHDHEPPSLTGP